MAERESSESQLGMFDNVAFAVVMALAAYLGRENPYFVHPEILLCFLAFLLFNLLNFSFLAKRWRPERRIRVAVAANAAFVSLIVYFSGGEDSYFWVMYLLPIFSAALAFGRRGVGATLASVSLLLALFYLRSIRDLLWPDILQMSIKVATLVLSTSVLMRVAVDERKARRLLVQEHDRSARERREMRERLQHMDRLATIGTLSASITHELKSPLTTILGSCELALEAGLTKEEMLAAARRVHNSALRLQRTIQETLAFARRDAALRRAEDVNALVRHCVELKRYDWSGMPLEVEEDLDPASPLVSISAPELQQVVFNLLTNAEQAILSRSGLRGRIRVSTRRENGRVRIGVEDNGPGIPAKALPKIWEPFFTTKPAGQGTGLGLPICRKIVESYDGTLTAESDPGRRTAFIAEFPAGSA